MSFTVSAPELAYALAVQAAPAGASVETELTPETPAKLPYVLVSTTAPASAANGPQEAASGFDVVLSCYAETNVDALHLCLDTYEGFYRLWRTRTVTDYGWISHISRDSLQPRRVASVLANDDAVRYDAVVRVVARH